MARSSGTGLSQHQAATEETSLGDGTSIRERLLASGSEIRGSAEGAEDVTDIVGGLDTSLEGGVPAVQDAGDDLDTGIVEVLDGGLEATGVDVAEMLESRLVGVGLVEVGSGAHDNDTGEVGQVAGGSTQQGLQGCVVLLSAGAVLAGAVGPDLGGVVEGLAEQLAAVVDVRGRDVAFHDGGRLGGGFVALGGVLAAVFLRGFGVGEVGLLGEGGGQIAQIGVHLEDFGAVDAGGVLVGGVGALGDVAGGEVVGEFAEVDLVLQGNLDGVSGEGGTADGGDLGVDTGDTSNEEVGVGEVKEGVEGNG